MKNQFLLLLLLISTVGFSQSINDYRAVIVPLRFEFQNSDNQYRLNTLSKYNLGKAGFEVYYANEILPKDITDKCMVLDYDVVHKNHLLMTRLFVTMKDCYGKIVYQSEVGISRAKEFDKAYTEALNKAFASIYSLNYKYEGKGLPQVKADKVIEVEEKLMEQATDSKAEESQNSADSRVAEGEVLYAQAIANGFQLIDSKPSIVMKIFKTSDKNSFMAQKGALQGVLVNKENQWFFEYYKNEKLVSEKVNVKF